MKVMPSLFTVLSGGTIEATKEMEKLTSLRKRNKENLGFRRVEL